MIRTLYAFLALVLLAPAAGHAQGPGGLGISLVTDNKTTVTGTQQMTLTGCTVTSGGTGTGIVNVNCNGGGAAGPWLPLAGGTLTGPLGVTPMTNPLVINANTGTLPTAPAGAMVQIVSADANAAGVNGFTYGANFNYQGYRAGGTQASPTAIAANDVILNFGAAGYDGTNYGAVVPADITALAAEAFTPTAHGVYWRFRTTTPGTLAKSEVMRVAGGLVTVGSSTSAPEHIASAQTTAPALTSCGTGSPTISGTDTAGTVTLGTTATGCVITFNVAYATAPHCVVTWRANPLAAQSYAVSAAAITLTQTSASGNLVDYMCVAPSGG